MYVPLVLVGAIVPRDGPAVAIVIAEALAIAAAMGWALRRVRGTTLAAPALWGLGSALFVAAVEAELSRRGNADSDSLLRYAAAVSTFCPIMAVLGAKRPQSRGWQWIAASLWIVLLTPAWQSLASKATRLELFPAWKLLLGGLLAMGLLNYLPTRRWLPAALVSAGQLGLLAPYLFDGVGTGDPAGRALALAAILAAAVIGLASPGVPTDAASRDPAGYTLRWRALRDGWGAFWALRVLQRFNQAAESNGWPVRLHWFDGLTPRDEPLAGPTQAAVEHSLESLFRRFERRGDESA